MFNEENTIICTRSTQVPPFWQGFDAHSLISVPQVSPVYPSVQLHLNEAESFTFMHVLLYKQGFGVQKSISISHDRPLEEIKLST